MKNFEDVDAATFEALRQEGKAVVLDVRTPAEAQQGMIPGAKLLNVMSPSFQNEVQRFDKSVPYLVYCRSGNRSAQACQWMADQGFQKVFNLRGGIGAWQHAVGK
ncbi:rhodanese-like domain-containing protein [Catalinimonas alkaloidigena]|uniref:rhodanese-like domain-containing protein n=1 Tax=Catalinimonas alkaloidigena TaxID=1075417 RepID=UPI001FE0FAED|nr:rhodanese-like domain-containing protein [Catalinimonas alkaloidigena]